MTATAALPASVDATLAALQGQGYVAERTLATAVFLALQLQRPLFLEGEPGTGKTEIAKALAGALGRPLLRLQCHEGLDLAGAAYEWNAARQLLEIRLAQADGAAALRLLADGLYAERFLIRRALLQAVDPPAGTPTPVLLIDELDRADEPFEAFLLEILAENQITIPELGTRRATQPPIVVLTSNRTREVHDAVKRRCLYHWVGYPDAEREAAILARRVPQAPAALAAALVAFMQRLRQLPLVKQPGVAETLDWARALLVLAAAGAEPADPGPLTPAAVRDTLGVLLKYPDDLQRIDDAQLHRLLQAPP